MTKRDKKKEEEEKNPLDDKVGGVSIDLDRFILNVDQLFSCPCVVPEERRWQGPAHAAPYNATTSDTIHTAQNKEWRGILQAFFFFFFCCDPQGSKKEERERERERKERELRGLELGRETGPAIDVVLIEEGGLLGPLSDVKGEVGLEHEGHGVLETEG